MVIEATIRVGYDAHKMTAHDVPGRRLPAGTVGAVLKRPRLWGEAARSVFAMSRPGWWRRVPFLPVPEQDYLEWRTATAYGSSDADVDPDDLVAYLEWRRTFRRAAR